MDIKEIVIYNRQNLPISYKTEKMKRFNSVASQRKFRAKQIDFAFTVSGPSGRIIGQQNDYVCIEEKTSVIFVTTPKHFERVYIAE